MVTSEKINKYKNKLASKIISKERQIIREEDQSNLVKEHKSLTNSYLKVETDKELPNLSKIFETKNILLIGTEPITRKILFDMLSGDDYSKEVTAVNGKVKCRDFNEGWKIINVSGDSDIDINDISKSIDKAKKEEVLCGLAEFVETIKGGFSQIFIAVSSEAIGDEKWLESYKLLSSIIFDDKIKDYITIVLVEYSKNRNKESSLSKIRKDIVNKDKVLFSKTQDLIGEKIIIVQGDKEKWEEGKNCLMSYLLEKRQNGVYRPENLSRLSRIISVRNMLKEDRSGFNLYAKKDTARDVEKYIRERRMEIVEVAQDKRNEIESNLVNRLEMTDSIVSASVPIVTGIISIATAIGCRIM